MKKLVFLLLISQSVFAYDCNSLTQSIDKTSDYYNEIYNKVFDEELIYDEYMDAPRIHELTQRRILTDCSCSQLADSIRKESSLFHNAFNWSLRHTHYYDEYMDHEIIERAALLRLTNKCVKSIQ